MNEYKDSRRGDEKQKMTGKGVRTNTRIGKKDYKAVSNSSKS